MSNPELLPPFVDESELVHVIIETPKGCRNKYAWDPELAAFKLKKTLPVGSAFPFDFGFIPSTEGEDGDPLDVLLLLDEPAFVGCVVEARLIGVLQAKQTEEGTTERNDRLIAVAEECEIYGDIEELDDLPKTVLKQIEHFFVSYNEEDGKRFKVVGRKGMKPALKILRGGMRSKKKK